MSPPSTPVVDARDPHSANAALEDLSSVFKALSDPARLKILRLLADRAAGKCCMEGVCGCDLETVTQLSQPTVSHHMKLLVSAQLVSAEKRGKWMFYTLNPDGFALLEQGSNLRFEYGDDGQPAVTYTVSLLEPTSEGLIVHLEWIGVRCKALDRMSAARAEAGLSELTVLEGVGESCTPGGACGC